MTLVNVCCMLFVPTDNLASTVVVHVLVSGINIKGFFCGEVVGLLVLRKHNQADV